jgi:hypothetical protein
MMKIKHLFLVLFFTSCASSSPYPDIADESGSELRLSSNDTTLVAMFNWALWSSGRFVGADDDPVGPWYESALPDRAAFCMRDISHQCIGEEINGHGRQNLNMMTKFVENISESKDWCSYWEINKYNLPASVDYNSDQDFWYNLNANFDVLYACYRLFLWTGDKTYIDDPRFDRFYRLTLNEYVEKWQLQADQIMQRPAIMNVYPASEGSRFRDKRGIPSYDEGVPNLHVTSDLLAVIYKSFDVYSRILHYKGDENLSAEYAQKAESYRQLYDSAWWNPATQSYYYASVGDSFLDEGGCAMFVPWYGLVKDPARLAQMLKRIAEKDINVEMRTYYPMTYYRHGMNDIAYHYLNDLHADKRRDYPEVASGMIESIVGGMMGIEPDATQRIIRTCPRLSAALQWVSVENVPTFAGAVSVLHVSDRKTSFVNKTGQDVVWRASFQGDYPTIRYDGKTVDAAKFTDEIGTTHSFADIPCTPGVMLTAEAVR